MPRPPLPRRAFAIAAHPDDTEFQMAGTLILLRDAGYQIHYMNIGNGCCGTVEYAKDYMEDHQNAARLAVSAAFTSRLLF